jgi:hypothetical protein
MFVHLRKRFRDWRCRHALHAWREKPVLDHERKPTRLIVCFCRNCGLNYRRWDPSPNDLKRRRKRAF